MLKFWSIRIAFVLVFVALGAHLYTLQVQDGPYYAKRAQARQEASSSLSSHRGGIFFTDKNGNAIPAVLNKEYAVVYAVPAEIEDPTEASRMVAPILKQEASDLERKFSKVNDLYELLLEKATSQQVEAIRSLNLAGLYITNETFRFYPFGSMAAQVLGFVSPSQDGSVAGRYGLELEFEDVLRGRSNVQEGMGDDVYTTIDRNIQAEAERILSSLVKEWNAQGGSIIVQNPHTGEIMAMANNPTFNPNDYSRYPIDTFINPAVELVYEPGSVFKVLTMSSALDAGVVTPLTTYNDTGSVTLNKRTIRNWDLKAHGIQTMTNVIEYSLNTGSVFAQQKLGNERFAQYVEYFGFGEKTDIALPGEVKGSLAPLYAPWDINFATASFGQGVSVTPLQMISAFSAVANDGVLLKPIIIKGEPTSVVRRVVSSHAAEQIIDMMVSAVDINILAHIPNYHIAGKTGTAFIPDFKTGGYTDNVINTYIGFTPAHGAQFTVLVKLDNPKGAPLAGQTVVPAFRQMTQFLVNYLEVAPDAIKTP